MQYQNFKEFYPFYLTQHSNQTCRRLHVIGSILVIFFALCFIHTFKIKFLILIPLCGYGFAWIGHAFFEKNKPATFQYPLFSLMGDFVMLKDVVTGKIKF